MNAIQKNYLAREVESASPAKLVLMLYDGVLSAIGKAEVEIAAKRVPEAHHQLIKAQDIVLSLANGLNMEAGGSIAQSLYLLYDFIYDALVRANLNKDSEPLQKIKEILITIRDAWDDGVVQGKPPPVSVEAA
ncbi:MAG: flagellar export chaperone FliS [Elusimicrobia bacterium]|jgi:flagellar protein FliS|nr:flagellar export chaperone FliS [Elusimicrobiota bacterium]